MRCIALNDGGILEGSFSNVMAINAFNVIEHGIYRCIMSNRSKKAGRNGILTTYKLYALNAIGKSIKNRTPSVTLGFY